MLLQYPALQAVSYKSKEDCTTVPLEVQSANPCGQACSRGGVCYAGVYAVRVRGYVMLLSKLTCSFNPLQWCSTFWSFIAHMRMG